MSKKTHATIITDFLISRGAAGATDIEGAAATGIKEHVYRAQRIALEKRNFVCASGERRDDGRKRPGRVYVHAQFASAERLEAAAEARERRARAKAGMGELHPKPAPEATESETPLGEQIDAGADDDPLFA